MSKMACRRGNAISDVLVPCPTEGLLYRDQDLGGTTAERAGDELWDSTWMAVEARELHRRLEAGALSAIVALRCDPKVVPPLGLRPYLDGLDQASTLSELLTLVARARDHALEL